jgi:hypothetical protein
VTSVDYWLPALRGEVWSEGALLHVATMRWVLQERAANGLEAPAEVVEALAEGDRRHVLDGRRRLNLDTWTVDVESDPLADALFELRAAAGDPVAMAAAIAEALQVGVPAETVRRTVSEMRHG